MNKSAGAFEKNVFVNCPFDVQYRPLLWAMLHTLKACGLEPRIAGEMNDSGELRFRKIVDLIKDSKYCVHDISRMEAAAAGDLARFNMPFELGLDLGLRESAVPPFTEKCCVIFDKEKYRFQKALSDLAGVDIMAHGDDPRTLVRQLRTWLAGIGIGDLPPGTGLWKKYRDFETLLGDTLRAKGWTEEDLESLGIAEFLMHLSYPELRTTTTEAEKSMRLDSMRAATPFPIGPETIEGCLNLEDPRDRLFLTAWRRGLDSISPDARRGALLGVAGHVAESVVEVLLDAFGYTPIHHFAGPGLHGVDLLLLTPGGDAIIAVEVKGTLRSGHLPRLSKNTLLQMTAPWLDKRDNPGMSDWGLKSMDVYGAVVFVNFADHRYRVAFTDDFENLQPVTGEDQLTDLGWLSS